MCESENSEPWDIVIAFASARPTAGVIGHRYAFPSRSHIFFSKARRVSLVLWPVTSPYSTGLGSEGRELFRVYNSTSLFEFWSSCPYSRQKPKSFISITTSPRQPITLAPSLLFCLPIEREKGRQKEDYAI